MSRFTATSRRPPRSGFLRRCADDESRGWWLIGVGGAVGFVFAAVSLVLSVVSFPLLLDRDCGVAVAVGTSLRLARQDPAGVALWGFIVAAGADFGFAAAVPRLGDRHAGARACDLAILSARHRARPRARASRAGLRRAAATATEPLSEAALVSVSLVTRPVAACGKPRPRGLPTQRSRQCDASTASSSSATMLVILIAGFTAGPAVSL